MNVLRRSAKCLNVSVSRSPPVFYRCLNTPASPCLILPRNVRKPLGLVRFCRDRFQSPTIGERQAGKTWGVSATPKKRHTYRMEWYQWVRFVIIVIGLFYGVGYFAKNPKELWPIIRWVLVAGLIAGVGVEVLKAI